MQQISDNSLNPELRRVTVSVGLGSYYIEERERDDNRLLGEIAAVKCSSVCKWAGADLSFFCMFCIDHSGFFHVLGWSCPRL